MVKALFTAVLVVLAGCSDLPQVPRTPSACDGGREATYACQIERHDNLNVQ